ncbi:MAG: methyltransferase domain-containing protein [Candidatus Magnetoovum sp. WYHC-5]|nr:methyltransferase domain-containing protein [Candidatus Magnetoovum sp. WYHC-5]
MEIDTKEIISERKFLTESDFLHLSEFIHSEVGIKMPASKKTMVEARLQRRLRILGMSDFSQYLNLVFSPKGFESEIIHLIDVLTTNKTDFFREPQHFNYLTGTAMPEIINGYGAGTKRAFLAWSAGCSTGEEPYTLAMVLSDFAEKNYNNAFQFVILATDISTRVLEKAKKAIYEEERVAPVPPNMKKKYLLKSKDKSKKLIRIAPEVRSLLRFRRLNFMDDDFGFKQQVDIIFCRNVVIYFDKQTQEKLLNKFSRCLQPYGYLFMGHSETLSGLNVPFIQVAPTIYKLAQ